jgi:thiamine pyrophosphate-dependent acetolactate synthase large subunit-like protein
VIVARPEATVVCVDGDGSFMMACQEVATAVSGLARGFGARGYTVRDEAEWVGALDEAPGCGETCEIDAKVAAEERLCPMIQPGSAAVDILEHPDQ